MSAVVGLNLANNYTGASATIGMPANQPPWVGGHCALVVTATTYATTTTLQYIPRSGTPINVQVLSGNGIYVLDLPSGQYQLAQVGGAVVGLYVDIVTIPYN